MNTIAFEIFGIGVAWYGIIIAGAMFIGTMLLLKIGKKRGYKENDLLDLVMVVLPSAIIGARLYYVAFEWDYYSANPNMILAFRQGGLAIHGGILGGLLGGFIFCKIRKLNFGELADFVSMPLILGQAIGRWGNFVNQEAHGGPTDLPWGIMIDGVKVHPTFLYESIWNLIVFGILIALFKKRQFHGEHFLKYLILYSVGRFFIEGLRTDSLFYGVLRAAQVFSILSIVGGIIVILWARKTEKWKIER